MIQKLVLVVLAMSSMACAADSERVKVREESNFAEVARQLEESSKVLLLEFHADHCGFCRQLEEDFLQPMLKNRDDQQKVLIRKLDVGVGNATITDFDGKQISVEQFAGRYQVYLTPTMVFLDRDGNEVSERIVGINTPSLFGWYIDKAIDNGLEKIRKE